MIMYNYVSFTYMRELYLEKENLDEKYNYTFKRNDNIIKLYFKILQILAQLTQTFLAKGSG